MFMGNEVLLLASGFWCAVKGWMIHSKVLSTVHKLVSRMCVVIEGSVS